MSHLAAETASDASIRHMRHGIRFQGVCGCFHRECWTARQANTGMITRASILINTEARALHPFAGGQRFGPNGLDPALAFQLAFAFGDDHLETIERGIERLLQRGPHF